MGTDAEVNKMIGKNIRRRRVELGLSQEELAARCGFKSKSSINKMEAGVQGLPQSKIVAVAKALETTPGIQNPRKNLVNQGCRGFSMPLVGKKVGKNKKRAEDHSPALFLCLRSHAVYSFMMASKPMLWSSAIFLSALPRIE